MEYLRVFRTSPPTFKYHQWLQELECQGIMYEVFKNLFFVTYAIGKDLLSWIPEKKYEFLQPLKKFLLTIFGIALLIILFFFILPFKIFHTCLHITLKYLHGESYGELLNGCDIFFDMKSKRVVMNVVIIFSCLDSSHVLIEKLTQCANQLHQSSYKFSSEIRRILGYYYYLKNRVSVDEVIDITRYDNNKYMTKENLLDYLETKCSTMTTNQMWKAIFFSQPILWNIHREEKQMAVVLSFRHALGDFPSIMGFIKQHFQLIEDTNIQNYKPNACEENLNLDNISILWNPLTSLQNKISLQVPNTLNHLIATYIEEKIEYIPKIKQIKQKLNATFIEVFVAAISRSIYEFAYQKKIELKDLRMATVVRPMRDDILEIVNGTYNFQDLTNRFGLLIFNSPFKLNEKGLKAILMDMPCRNKITEHTMDAYMTFAILNYLVTYLPENLMNLFYPLVEDYVISSVSNVVGLSRSTCCGNTIEDIFFYTPDFLNIGFTFFINSYSGRVQFTVVSKAGFIHNREELQQILSSVFRNIDELSRDISSESS